MKYLETLREWACRVWGTFRGRPSDRELEREPEFHLEMAKDELARRGHSPQEAARLARRRFGRVPRALEALHDQRGLPWLGRFSLDVMLGVRRLRKSWGLTLIGGFAMTLAIAIAAGAFSFVRALSGGPLPLDEGDRIVAIRTWSDAGRSPLSTAFEDFRRWRDELVSLDDVGAFRTVSRNLIPSGTAASPGFQQEGGVVNVAEMSAAGFRLARVPPLLGRPLIEADERDGAERVVVIGFDAWRSRFAADPQVVGRHLRLDGTLYTIVGVMPKGFAFPINHEYWIPLHADSPDFPWAQGPQIFVFGRLSPGATLDGAQAELRTLGLAARPLRSDPTGLDATGLDPTELDATGLEAAAGPGRLYPRIMPYAKAFLSIEDGWSSLILLLFTMLLVPPCANIAMLVYARTVVRQEEFAMRVALGATRLRIVVQLFIEMFVLSAAAAIAALGLVHLLLARATISSSASPGASPFWMDLGVSAGSAFYVGALAMLAAAIAGIVPAIQATGRLMQSGLRALGGGSGAMRLGKLWNAMVVVQVALAVLMLPLAAELGWGQLRPSLVGPGFDSQQYVTARVQYFGAAPPDSTSSSDITGGSATRRLFAARVAAIESELVRRLEAHPGVSAVAVSQLVPGAEPSRQVVELERIAGSAPADARGERAERGRLDSPKVLTVTTNRIGPRFFEAFDVAFLAGRAFRADDFEPGRDAVVINRAFAERMGREVGPSLGMRVRDRHARPSNANDWHEIVGVVADLPANDDMPRLYLPLTPGRTQPISLTFRVEPGVEGIAGRLREIAASIDPGLVVDEARPLDEVYLRRWSEGASMAAALAVVTLSVLLLSAAGMYALMSFVVNQRRREIGIRSAIGARPRRLLAAIFKRSLVQIAVGAAVGLAAASVLDGTLPIQELGGREVPGVLPAAAIVILAVGALAALGPALRALKVAPIDALRDGG